MSSLNDPRGPDNVKRKVLAMQSPNRGEREHGNQQTHTNRRSSHGGAS
jgi:hypothetical protein